MQPSLARPPVTRSTILRLALLIVFAGSLTVAASARADARRCGGNPEICYKAYSNDNIVTRVTVFTTSTTTAMNNVYARIWLTGPNGTWQIFDKPGMNLPKATSSWWAGNQPVEVTFCSRAMNINGPSFPNSTLKDPCYRWPQNNFKMGGEFWWGSKYHLSLRGAGQTIAISGTF